MPSDSKFNDQNSTISFFKSGVKKFVENRNWTKYHTPKDLALAISIEAAELSEHFLFKERSVEEILNDKELLNNISDEVADVFIYVISFLNSLNIDLTQSFIRKMEKNNRKYPVDEFNKGNYYKK